jgi:LPPG:FO 2-phospho-L-lactate transferase
MSDEMSSIIICTDEGDLEFHEFLVERQAQPQVTDIVYNQVSPAPGVIEAVENSDMVLIGPSNPITSIGPIISTKGVRKSLKDAYVVAVSPIIGDKPVSGPAAKFMHAMGYDVSSVGVAGIYQDFLDKFIMDTVDASYQKEIEKLISDVMITHTIMYHVKDKVSLARKILGETI